MSFSTPELLWMLLALPPLSVLEWLALRRGRKRLRTLVGERADHALLEQWWPARRRLSALLRLAAFGLLALGAAGPEWGRELARRPGSGSDLVFVMDVSASMDTRDVRPSRMEEARREALAVLDRVEGSRVAVVAFAGEAVRICPLTQDRAAARLTLESVSTSSVSDPGTDLGRGLRSALRTLPGGWREEQAVVLWTDGEDLERGASDAARELERAGVRVFAVGVGTKEGDVIPVLDDQGRAVDIKLDERGVAVRSRLDEALLRELAQRTHGAYFSARSPGGELPRLLSALSGIGRAARGGRLTERPVARFRVFGALAMLLLALETAVPRRRKSGGRAAETAAGARGVAAAALLAVLLATAAATEARAQSAWARGDEAFRAGRYAVAESLYARRLAHGGPDPVRVNRATARAFQGHRDSAETELRRLSGAPGAAGLAAEYNLGTSAAERGAWDDALAALRRVLERNPSDGDARWNYELAMRRREQERNAPPPPSPQSNPSPRGGGGGAQPPPSPGGDAGAPPPAAPPTGPAPRPGSLSRAQAERLLSLLEDVQRLEARQRRDARVPRERRGRDW